MPRELSDDPPIIGPYMNAALVRCVKSYLARKDMHQSDLARKMRISAKHLSNVLRGKVRLTEGFARRLSGATDISFDELKWFVTPDPHAPAGRLP